ncbi:MAG: Hsp20/alpha crystallin family protein [Alphaproteobacteria bacterium]
MNKVMEKVPVGKAGSVAPVQKRWQALDSLREEVDRLFKGYEQDFWQDQLSVFDGEFWGPMIGRGKLPPVDMVQKNDEYEIMVELPGLDEKEVEVKYGDGMLTIAGEKKEETEEKEEGYLVSERRRGAFKRSFRLPETVDPTKIEARFEKGVLKVTLPMKPEARSDERKITVKAA